MSKPPLNPDKSAAGIAVDPHTLQRVIPESKRPDGSVRKQIKIRPGFTPQEDVRRFRGTKQVQMDHNALPKGHIIGWAPPPSTAASTAEKPLSKSAKKNQKRREAKKKESDEPVADNWEDDEDTTQPQPQAAMPKSNVVAATSDLASETNPADALADKLEQLNVKSQP